MLDYEIEMSADCMTCEVATLVPLKVQLSSGFVQTVHSCRRTGLANGFHTTN